MSKSLGVGARVYIGYVEDRKVVGKDARLQTGTIDSGPINPGEVFRLGDDIYTVGKVPIWAVHLDVGYRVAATENVLFPIDDDDDATEREAERPREVEHV